MLKEMLKEGIIDVLGIGKAKMLYLLDRHI